VRQFIEWSAAELGVELKFEGLGIHEQAIVTKIIGNDAPAIKVGDILMKIDPRYFRPTEVETLLGDPTKAKEKLGWEPEIKVKQMCREMVINDLLIAKQHALLNKHGFKINVSSE
jgi:GDPmannose 4,6-dehydratase